MFRIKRTKAPAAPATTPPAVHFAVTCAPAGNITEWTPSVAKAGEFDDSFKEKVVGYYRHRENVGKLDFETVPTREVPEEKPVTPKPQVPPATPAETTASPASGKKKAESGK